MNDQTVQMIAQAIIANTKVIQSLIDSLPKEAVQAVAQAANVTAVAPVQQVVQAAPVVAPAPVPVAAPVPVPAAVQMPAAPFPVTPAPVVATPVAAPAAQAVQAPFTDTNGLIQYIMGAYQAMGPTKGAHIQGILTKLGYQRVNDVQPQHYGDLYQAVEALKAA